MRRTADLILTEAMQAEALITVAIPTFNRAERLRDCLTRVLALPASQMAVVVSDNASTDGTMQVVGSFRDARLRYVRNTRNIGLFGNLNRCLEATDTPFVVILPDDDEIDAALLPICLTLLQDETLAAAVTCNRYRICDSSGIRIVTPKIALTRQVMTGDALLAALWNGTISFQISGVVFRTERLRAVGGFSINHPYAGDLVAYGKLFIGNQVGFDPTPCSIYTIHDGSESAKLGSAACIRDLAAVFGELTVLADELLDRASAKRLRAAIRCYLTRELGRHYFAARQKGFDLGHRWRLARPILPWVATHVLRGGRGSGGALLHFLPLRIAELIWTTRRLLKLYGGSW